MIILSLSVLVQFALAQTAPIQAEYKPGELNSACKAAVAKADEKYKAIAALKPGARTMDTTILAAEERFHVRGDAQ
jgi:hypothetical protein